MQGVLPAWALNAALEHYRRETPELALVIFRRQGGNPILYVSGPPDEVHQNLVWAKGFLKDAADLVDSIGIEDEDFDDLED